MKYLRNAIYGNDVLYKAYQRLKQKPRYPSLDHFLHTFAAQQGRVHFVQIGANDGVGNDPIYKYVRTKNWRGELIEPQPDVFSSLKANYPSHKGLEFHNIAIGDPGEKLQLHRFSFSDARWLHGWATFDRETLVHAFNTNEYLRSRAKNEGIAMPESVDDAIESLEVKTVTLMDFFAERSITKLDLMVIDVEGHEPQVFNMLDFQKVDVTAILFEHRHLNDQLEVIYKSLNANGYQLIPFEFDTIAIKEFHPLSKYLN